LYRKVQSEEKRGKKPKDEAIVCLRVNGGGKGRGNYQISIGNDGPVDTLNKAIRKALMPKFAKAVKGIRLKDYKVRTINGGNGTRASVRVLIDFSDGKSNWTTVGVSRDILGASCDAFSDAYEYAILKAR
jgi:2-isopropylmalate synthase